jgi:hypothetical protein
MPRYQIVPMCGYYDVVDTATQSKDIYHYYVAMCRYKHHAETVCAALNSAEPQQTEAQKRHDYYRKKDERGYTAADYNGEGGPGSGGGVVF